MTFAPTFKAMVEDAWPETVVLPATPIVLPAEVGVSVRDAVPLGTVREYARVLALKLGLSVPWLGVKPDRKTAGGRGVTVNDAVEPPSEPL
jgi:hypothetical protein